MEPSNPAAPEPQHVRGSMKDAPEGTRTPERAIEQPTVLNERAYPGPTKEDLTLLNTHSVAENPQTQVTVGDVVRGFRELGKDMTTSEMLTILLRALAKDETETLFEWVLLERFRDNPPADGMGHWEQLCSVIPNLDKSWHSLAETYEVVICYCSDATEDDPSFGPTVAWSTIRPNSNRHMTPSSPVQPPPSPIRSFVRSPLASKISSPTSHRRNRATPQPYFEPAISFPKPLGENGAQEVNEDMILHSPKKMKLPPPTNLLTLE